MFKTAKFGLSTDFALLVPRFDSYPVELSSFYPHLFIAYKTAILRVVAVSSC